MRSRERDRWVSSKGACSSSVCSILANNTTCHLVAPLRDLGVVPDSFPGPRPTSRDGRPLSFPYLLRLCPSLISHLNLPCPGHCHLSTWTIVASHWCLLLVLLLIIDFSSFSQVVPHCLLDQVQTSLPNRSGVAWSSFFSSFPHCSFQPQWLSGGPLVVPSSPCF